MDWKRRTFFAAFVELQRVVGRIWADVRGAVEEREPPEAGVAGAGGPGGVFPENRGEH